MIPSNGLLIKRHILVAGKVYVVYAALMDMVCPAHVSWPKL